MVKYFVKKAVTTLKNDTDFLKSIIAELLSNDDVKAVIKEALIAQLSGE